MMPGRLILVPTPIGNLEDVTLRSLDVLRSADAIAAEDTRRTRKLLSRYDIHNRLVAYHAHNERAKTPALLERIRGGETLALVSDAGTPGIADPGHRLVVACLDAALPVEVLPGPSAFITALVASGLPTERFSFLGWAPRSKKEIGRLAEKLAETLDTSVLYESPKRLAATLAALAAVLPDRQAAVARELTKVHEEMLRGTLEELAGRVGQAGEVRGEIVLVVGGAEKRAAAWADESALSEVAAREAAGETTRDAIRSVAADLGVGRRELYEAVMAAQRDKRPKRSPLTPKKGPR
jgi:16S rRNA (cytidine1402-2'-O)-methyltransferase